MLLRRPAVLALLLAFSGCMKIREDLIVLPDGSGRLTFTFSIANRGEAAGFTEAELMSGDPDEIAEKVRGLAAMTRPVLEKADGEVRIRMTAYFDDVNALKFMDDGEGEKAKPKQEFRFRKTGEAFTLELLGNLLADEVPERAPGDPEREKQKEEMFKAMFAGFGFRNDVKMPGTVTEADGFTSKAGRVASYRVEEKDLQKPADQKKINALTRFKVSCGKSEMSDAELADFRKELDQAKAAWPELRKEMKKKSERK
ncbi:MAG: hypothetical protein JO332_02085 [Planctomycetaceae bacterium]|nr:hypothetical protein [Planctomycetaceae bacterium]